MKRSWPSSAVFTQLFPWKVSIEPGQIRGRVREQQDKVGVFSSCSGGRAERPSRASSARAVPGFCLTTGKS